MRNFSYSVADSYWNARPGDKEQFNPDDPACFPEWGGDNVEWSAPDTRPYGADASKVSRAPLARVDSCPLPRVTALASLLSSAHSTELAP